MQAKQLPVGPVALQLTKIQSNSQHSASPPATIQIPSVKQSKKSGQGNTNSGSTDKTSWDWIQLIVQVIGAFAIPISLIGLFISVMQFNEQQRNSAQQALDQQQQITLETYLDHMSDLLFTNHLNVSQPGDETRSVARARTLAALKNLNGPRKGILLQFLYESGLINNQQSGDRIQNPIIDLSGADLRGANLVNANLNAANLNKADLSSATLFNTDLRSADLITANLSAANLVSANLSSANMSGANLSGANLTFANLSGANLSGATLPDGSSHR